MGEIKTCPKCGRVKATTHNDTTCAAQTGGLGAIDDCRAHAAKNSGLPDIEPSAGITLHSTAARVYCLCWPCRLQRSVKRLVRLTELRAPLVIIDNEMRLLRRAYIATIRPKRKAKKGAKR